MNNENGSFPPPSGLPVTGEPVAPAARRTDVFGNVESPFGPVVEGSAQSFADFANNSTLTNVPVAPESSLPLPSTPGAVPGFVEAPAAVAKRMVRPDSVLTVPDSALAPNRPSTLGQ